MNSNEYMNDNGATPVVPLPGSGESSPVYSGSDFAKSNDTMTAAPTVTLSGSPENGPSYSGGDFARNNDVIAATPVIPLPNPGEGGPVYPGNTDSGRNGSGINIGMPVIPLPNPGEGGPVYPGNMSPGFQGTVITVLPRPVTPCFYCNSNSYGTIRFLNAAIGYTPFVISVNNRTAVDTLEYAEVSEYGRISSGYQTITVSGRNGYIYISKQIRVNVGATMTVAIVNTAGGLNIVEINDTACYTPMGGSCIRVSNLSYNAGPLTLSTYSGNVSFRNVNFMEITNYVRVVPARYEIFVSNRNEVLLSTELTARSGSQYTVYLFNWTESPTAIRTLIIEDRK